MIEIFFVIRNNVPGKNPTFFCIDGSWTEDLNNPSVRKFSSFKKAWNKEWDLMICYGNICVIERQNGRWEEKENLTAKTIPKYWHVGE